MKRLVALLLLASIVVAQEPSTVSTDPAAGIQTIAVPAGTSVIVEMVGAPNSETIHEKEFISFTVLRDVELNGKVVIAKGAAARAVVMHSRHSGRGHDGEIAFRMSDVTSVDGRSIPLRFAKVQKKGTKGEDTLSYVIASPILFYYSPIWVPMLAIAAPVGMLRHGKPKQLPEADRFEVYIAEDSSVQVP